MLRIFLSALLGWLTFATPVFANDNCQAAEISVPLFQIHHKWVPNERCLQWKLKAEPAYIAHQIPSAHFHQFQDSNPLGPFEVFQYCFDEQTEAQTAQFIAELDAYGLLSFTPNGQTQFGSLNSLHYNVSRQLRRVADIQQNGAIYYGMFSETQCDESPTNRPYEDQTVQLFEERMNLYHQLLQIWIEHAVSIEEISFLPDELETL